MDKKSSQQQKLGEQDKAVIDSIFDHLQPLGISLRPASDVDSLEQHEDDPELNDDSKALLKQAILLAEERKFEEALSAFGELLKVAPRSASVLNDRAQTLRLAGKNEEALADLDRALELSEGRGSIGVRALCQRGALYRYLDRDEEAREDFAKAAEAGSRFAKAQLVAMNPYAAMCNAMLQKMGAHPL